MLPIKYRVGSVMKNLGMIGGVSCESTAVYYKLINEKVNSELGGLYWGVTIIGTKSYSKL